MMRSFLLSSAIKRLTWCVAGFGSLFAFLAIAAILAHFESWATAGAAYRNWTTGDKAERCQQMYAEAKPYLDKIDNRYCKSDLIDKYDRLLDCVRKPELRVPEGVSEVAKRYIDSGCPMGETKYRLGWELVPPSHPGHLIAYTWNSIDVEPALLPAAFLALVALLFMLTDIVRTFLLEPHIGWRRLTIVASVISAVIVPLLIVDEIGDQHPQMVFVSLAALIGTAASILYGRRVFFWVYSGFKAEALSGDRPNSPLQVIHTSPPTDQESTATLITPTTVESQEVRLGHVTLEGGKSPKSYCSSCQAETEHDGAYCSVCGRNAVASEAYIKSQKIRIWKMPNWFPWVGWIGAIALVALNFAYNRNEATQALVSSLVQIIGLLIIYGIYRLFSGKK